MSHSWNHSENKKCKKNGVGRAQMVGLYGILNCALAEESPKNSEWMLC
jgi:hypothetical protein